jgi:hypothetical protein
MTALPATGITLPANSVLPDIQMTLPAVVVDSFASFKGDSAARGTALSATRMTQPLTRITLPATLKILPTTETVLESYESNPCVSTTYNVNIYVLFFL